MNAKYNEQKHQELLAVGRKLEKGVAHRLEEPFVDAILATLQFFNADQAEMQQFIFDLKVAKYKVWDFLGMNYDSHYMQEKPVYVGIEKLVDLYIAQNNLGGFGWFLRGHDLQVEDPHRCEDCVQSYLDWKKQMEVANVG
jgi:hypothetical protein